MEEIKQFDMEYSFLSNFVGGVEQKFQAAKTLDPEMSRWIRNMKKPGSAKWAGHQLKLRPDWDEVKYKIMEDLVREKFAKEPFKAQLLATGDAKLIEGNYWHDTIWGICNCKQHRGAGTNWLGEILMKVRNELYLGRAEVLLRRTNAEDTHKK